MKCLTVYTGDFDKFAEHLEEILALSLEEGQDTTVDDVSVNHSGLVDDQFASSYFDKMSSRLDVAVMRDQERDLTILQYGEKFEVFLPEGQLVAVE